jgi:alginate O-acetyltransferase complex protein AlgJ
MFVLVPIVLVGLTEALLLPPTFFTYRTWEALVFKNPIPHMGSFYPNMKTEMSEQGDLAFHSNFAEIRDNIVWKTDELGYRNNTFIKQPDVVIVGDSFMAGVTLSQENTFANLLDGELPKKISVYNMSPSTFGNFDFLLSSGVIGRPKLVIFSIVERSLPAVLGIEQERRNTKLLYLRKVNKMLTFPGLNSHVDRFVAFNSIKWATSRLHGKTGNGIQSEIDSAMFFFQAKSVDPFSAEIAERTSEQIFSYKNYCDGIGIDFLFLPMPNKESVYPEIVPLENEPTFLLTLDSLLRAKGIQSINSLKIYKENKGRGELFYQYDDTHWNAKGAALLAREVANLLNSKYDSITRLARTK